jgi:thymidine phosphorylase
VSARIVDLIARKRDGGELTAAELAEVISPETPDYQPDGRRAARHERA